MLFLKRDLFSALTANLGVLLLYMASGWLSLQISAINAFTAVIFFPAGVALAACLTYRLHQVVPGIFLGAYLLNLFFTQSQNVLSPAGQLLPLVIAVASSLQAMIGSKVMRRFVSAEFTLSHEREILRFIVSVPLICLISATLSVTALSLHQDGVETFLSNWAGWWAGDSMGILVALPLVMSFCGQPVRIDRKAHV